MINYKEVFDSLKEDSDKYCLLVGWVDLHKDEEEPGRFYMQDNIQDNEYIQKAGSFPEDLIRDAIANHEWKVDKEGFYEFWCLMFFSKGSDIYGESSCLEVVHIEPEFQISFEDRDAQMKQDEELYKDTDLFGNKTY